MLNQSIQTSDKTVQQCVAMMQRFLSDCHPRDFAIRFWDGSELEPEAGQPARFTLVIKHPAALRKMFWHPDSLSLGEGFIFNDFDVEGDLEAAIRLQDIFTGVHMNLMEKIQFAKFLLTLPHGDRNHLTGREPNLDDAPSSRRRAKQAISYHYDLPMEFWRLWLDGDLQYSCAYFENMQEDLQTAQRRKLDYICRKLYLRPGERFFDLGCGWGGLLIHAVRHYGVEGHGLTLSEVQAEHARVRIQQLGLEDRCRVEVIDFRDFKPGRLFDKISSVGVMEHCSRILPEYFGKVHELLKPGGLFLNQAIAADPGYALDGTPNSFIEHYVFPGGDLVPIHQTLKHAGENGFEVRDVENLREHYARTLHVWMQNLERAQDSIRRVTDDVTYRIFRLYLAGCAHNFQLGRMHLFQTLLARPDRGRTPLPPTRRDWYR